MNNKEAAVAAVRIFSGTDEAPDTATAGTTTLKLGSRSGSGASVHDWRTPKQRAVAACRGAF